MSVLTTEEAQLKLKDLRQALAIEKQHRYIDVQGKRKQFSSFVLDTLYALKPLQIVSEADADNNPLQALIRKFKQYRFMDMSNRMQALESVEHFVTTFQSGHTLQRKTTVAASVTDERPLSSIEVQFVKGVGPKLSSVLKQVGVNTVEDLIYYFPRRYLDYQHRVPISQLQEGQEVTVMATIRSVSAYQPQNRPMTIVSVALEDDTGTMHANWFYGKSSRAQIESYKNRFVKGAEVMLSGKTKWDKFKRTFAIDRGQLEILSYHDDMQPEQPESLHAGRIVPVYALTEGLNLRGLRKAIHQSLTDHLHRIADPIPEDLKSAYGLPDLQHSLKQIHFPETSQHYEDARERLVFDELLYLQIRLALMRQEYKKNVKAFTFHRQSGGYIDRFLEQLPFNLTGAQQRVFEEILSDMGSPQPMYRMLQGDVGSGKTVVAALTLLVALENGYQGALMAPTEILAEQHYRKFVDWFVPLGLKVGLVVGKLGQKERREIKQGLLNGQIHVAIGTHALIQDDVEFHKLGAVVIDEQHRFGVRQRTLLKSKGEHPEMLTMTATPIPRTLAMTMHGDLDVSLLDELPPGRTPIKTVLLTSKQQQQAYQLIRHEISLGRQAYVVFPLIEESETLAAKAATSEADRLKESVFPDLKIGLLHGKLKPEEKDAVMTAFIHKQLDVLVSTTVIEVGVDVPNATIMVIENADRFGLAQLHQLRGRVGRGSHQSYCVLVSDSRSDETMQRLGILVQSQDGFYLAEKDLEIRGPGEFLGTKQSGLPDFALADLIRDQETLEKARTAAQRIADNPAYLAQHPQLESLVFQKTEEKMGVLGSG